MGAELNSLQPLALLGLRAAGADGCAICDFDPASGRRTLKFSCGVSVPDSEADSKSAPLSVAEFPLRVEDRITGILAFVFRGAGISEEARAMLGRVAGQVEAVWRFGNLPEACATAAAKAGELEVELADSKIADRARGLLAKGAQTRGALDGAVDVVERHVESVLRSSQLTKALEEMSRELEEKVAERKLVTQAKAVLQSLHGISEEEAHLQLQTISRKTRRPVREVARELSLR
jgi:hypothetical protein